jgi:hypothetical protein
MDSQQDLCRKFGRFSGWLLAILGVLLFSFPLLAQTTISTGSIVGTVTDPSGAVISGAKVTITNQATGQVADLTTNSAGAYNSGALIPGSYQVRVAAKGFSTASLPVVVQVGGTSAANVKLSVGQESQVVEVQASEVQVNTEQPTVQGVLNAQQIENLPVNGRNFLDLAQLEPGVQIQDGGNFDPTKNGFSSVSFGGRAGRTARIEVDGIDISDETVGTTTQNIPQSAIQEFQIEQSSLDLSTELTSSGAVNITTRSGTNGYHGEGYYLFRDKATAANIGGDAPFQRNGFGGRLGGPIIKDKLFFFADGERVKQDLTAPVILSAPFTSLSGGFSSPFKEKEALGRLDWNIKPNNFHVFYRFSYNNNTNVSGFIPNSYQPFANRDNTAVHAIGLDFNSGSFTHAIRAGYTKFTNHITDPANRPFDLIPGLSITIGASSTCLTPGLALFCSGPNILAPQATFQSNKQLKYDGSKVAGNHVLRYGVSVNKILGGGLADFFGLAPIVRSSNTPANEAAAAAGPFPGGITNPLNWPVSFAILGNGQGFFTEVPQFGLPAGGQFDTRFAWYVGDSWKIKPYFTLTAGLRYVRDTGRSDSDLAPIPCSALDRSIFPVSAVPCSGNLLDMAGAGLGNRVRQPNSNFAPQLGFAWDTMHDGKTVIRGGIGLFYENAIFNNILFDRPARLEKGLFNGISIDTDFTGEPIGVAAAGLIAAQKQFQAQTAAQGPTANGLFVGELLSASSNCCGTTLYAPNYRSPRSIQMNIGIQRQIANGTVLSADYVRNVSLHYLLADDVNRVGDARFLNVPAAQTAISATNDGFGCGSGIDATSINCAIGKGATISDYASNGLDSGSIYLGGVSAWANGLTPATGAAFAGINPNMGQMSFLFPSGRSVYNALQAKLVQTLRNPLPGVKSMNLQVAYALSRFKSQADDQDFINNVPDYNNPGRFFGPSGLDRTHQLSFGAVISFPKAFQVSFTSRFATAIPATLLLPSPFGGTGDIFTSDWTGDGTGFGADDLSRGDPLPGTSAGAFGRTIKVGGLNNAISNYNNNFAGKLTPAGQALVNAGLFTPAQLTSLQGVMPTVQPAPAGQVGIDASRNFDMKASWPIRIKERLTIEPSVSIYNLFNFANFDPAQQPLSGILDGAAGSVNGTTYADRTNRVRPGSGVYWFGVPRIFEWGLRMTF